MTIAELILTIVVTLVAGLVLLVFIVSKYDCEKYKIENEHLKEKLRKKDSKNARK